MVNNYRPISLATILARVLDGVLNRDLDKHLCINDIQFDFISEHFKETAISCMTHTA